MNHRGFTLIELLVVIVIVLLISVLTLPTLYFGLQHRQVSEAARTLQGAVVGARDQAIRDNSPSGIRLVPDATLPNCYSAIVPLSSPPSYSNGLVGCFPTQSYQASVMLGTQAIVLEESTVDINGLIGEPTAWFWNVRVGDKLRINDAGPWYTVCGPMVQANDEGFTNCGSGTAVSPIGHDWLLLTNGHDDDGNGIIDTGWNGLDDNQNGVIDESAEWEQESWLGSLSAGITLASYSIQRRPVPGANAKSTALPSNIVVDLSRSVLPQNPLIPSIDVIVSPNGSMSPALLYSTPSSIQLGGSFFQFWLSERADVSSGQMNGSWWLVTANSQTGRISEIEQPDVITGLAQARQE